MSDATPLGPGGEFDVIRGLAERWGALAVGLGDDAATLAVPRGEQLVASTDAALDGIHFRHDWLSLDEIGYRAVTAALSDLAAMAAQPLGVLVSLQLPALDRAELDALADGIGRAARAAGTVIRGGNVARGGELGITTTVLGSAFAPLTRAAARAGDTLYVTGTLGGPSAALRALAAGGTPDAAARARFAAPVARIAEARWLAAQGAVAAIDLSDGLAGDAAHLAAASGVTLDVDVADLPLVAGAEPDDLFGGEEYELLVTSRTAIDAAAFAQRFGIPLTAVGRVSGGGAAARFSRRGQRVAPPPGHDHFSR